MIFRTLVPFLWILLSATSQLAADDDHGHAKETGFNSNELLAGNVYFPHIHGIAFPSGSSTIALAAHDGLWLYEAGKWSHTGNAHDYMGFAPFDGGFYAGGHPDLLTDLPNPLGLMKVHEYDARPEPVRFAGEHDFHLIATGRSGRTIYLYVESDSRQLQSGLYYSADYGANWQRAVGYPANESPVQLAAHPSAEGSMALIAEGVAYLTTDHGNTFAPIHTVENPTSIAFHADGRHLLIGTQDLLKMELATGNSIPFPGPLIGDEVFEHIGINYTEPRYMAAVTSNRSLWLTLDSGIHWNIILDAGRATH